MAQAAGSLEKTYLSSSFHQLLPLFAINSSESAGMTLNAINSIGAECMPTNQKVACSSYAGRSAQIHQLHRQSSQDGANLTSSRSILRVERAVRAPMRPRTSKRRSAATRNSDVQTQAGGLRITVGFRIGFN